MNLEPLIVPRRRRIMHGPEAVEAAERLECSRRGIGGGRQDRGRISTGGGAPTSPPLANLLVWAKNETLGAGTLVTWTDSSGSGNTLTASGTPAINATDAQYNNLKSVSCNGSTDWLATPAFTAGVYSAYIVMRSTGGLGAFLWCKGVSIDYVFTSTGNSINSARGVTSAWNLSALWGNSASPRTVTSIMDGTHAGHVLVINGAIQSLTNVLSGDPGAGTLSSALGVFASAAGVNKGTGTVGEFLFYGAAHDAFTRGRVEAYLRNKFKHY